MAVVTLTVEELKEFLVNFTSAFMEHINDVPPEPEDNICDICCAEPSTIHCSCDYRLCKGCARWCCENTRQDPHCPNPDCGMGWGVKFLQKKLTKKWYMGKYTDTRVQLLLESEKAKSSEYMSEHIRRREARMRREQSLDNIFRESGQEEKVKKCIFTCTHDGCHGLVTDDHRCVDCRIGYCRECRAVKNKGHECNPDDVATIKLLKSDSKACPKCGVLIMRVSGCAQMWCTQCHTRFSWSTGKILDTKHFHNPHEIEWRQKQGVMERERGDVVCGGLPPIERLPRCGGVTRAYRLTAEALDILERPDGYPFVDRDLREHYILYIINVKDEEKYKKKLRSVYKRQRQEKLRRTFFRLFVDVMIPLLRNLIDLTNDSANYSAKLESFKKEFMEFTKFYNERAIEEQFLIGSITIVRTHDYDGNEYKCEWRYNRYNWGVREYDWHNCKVRKRAQMLTGLWRPR